MSNVLHDYTGNSLHLDFFTEFGAVFEIPAMTNIQYAAKMFHWHQSYIKTFSGNDLTLLYRGSYKSVYSCLRFYELLTEYSAYEYYGVKRLRDGSHQFKIGDYIMTPTEHARLGWTGVLMEPYNPNIHKDFPDFPISQIRAKFPDDKTVMGLDLIDQNGEEIATLENVISFRGDSYSTPLFKLEVRIVGLQVAENKVNTRLIQEFE